MLGIPTVPVAFVAPASCPAVESISDVKSLGIQAFGLYHGSSALAQSSGKGGAEGRLSVSCHAALENP